MSVGTVLVSTTLINLAYLREHDQLPPDQAHE
jgi:hypothetical protein